MLAVCVAEMLSMRDTDVHLCCIAYQPYPSVRVLRAMDRCDGRLAFWHFGEESDDFEVFNITVQSLAGPTCQVRAPEYYTVQDLKSEVSVRIRRPEADVALLHGGKRLKPKMSLSAVFPSRGLDVTVDLIVARPACTLCGTRDGLWGRRAKLMRCEWCLDAYYCSRDCRVRDSQRHRFECF